MSEEEIYNQVENYVNRSFSESEKKAFEELLKTDIEVANQYNLYKFADELVIENRLRKVNSILVEEKNNKGGNFIKLIILSTIALLVSSLVFFLIGNKKSTYERTPLIGKIKKELTQNFSEQIKESDNIKDPLLKNNADHISIAPVEVETKEIINLQAKSELILNNDQKKENVSVNLDIEKLIVPISKDQINIKDNSICYNVNIEAITSSTASCKEESNGSILITNIKGGTAPYSINVKNFENKDVSFFNVPSGNYLVVITDKVGCSKTINSISVPEKFCEKEYSFNPFMDETFVFPDIKESVQLSIYERSGNLYFTKQINPFDSVHWNGYSKNGEFTIGYFIFVLTYTNGREERGGITIVR